MLNTAMFAPSEEGSKLKEYRGLSGVQLGILGQVHMERHTRNSSKRILVGLILSSFEETVAKVIY